MKSLIVLALLAVVCVYFVEGFFNKGGSNSMGGVTVITIPSGNSNNNNNCGGRVCGVSSSNSTSCRTFMDKCKLLKYNTNNSPKYSIVGLNRCTGIRIGRTGSCNV